MVIVELGAGGEHGIGYSYADTSTATLIRDHLSKVVIGHEAMSLRAVWDAMVHSIRNLGGPGISAMAISAIDTAAWDLKARLLNLPPVTLFGQVRDRMPIYGSGGFTSYSIDRLCSQLAGWKKQGIRMVKMKIGRDANADVDRVRAARAAIGDDEELFVDANGAYSRKQALSQAEKFAEFGVNWFEEPVSSDDLEGLLFIRERAPSEMEIAAGEDGYGLNYFKRMLASHAVDVLQADATRCPASPDSSRWRRFAKHIISLSRPIVHRCCTSTSGCATPALRHAEYFHDHVRIERMFFDGVPEPDDGALKPDLSRAGMGLELKRNDIEKFRL